MKPQPLVVALKLHRLGRTSFRAVKSKRDYLQKGSHFSWLYLSRLSALKEYAFMKALKEHGLPVPQAIDHNRHAVVMTMLDAQPLNRVGKLRNPDVVFAHLMELLTRLALLGLVHCDFNEFNVLINDQEELTLIDFPQMVSIDHPNAEELFHRDMDCVVRFFRKKMGCCLEHDEKLQSFLPDFQVLRMQVNSSLDRKLRASGFTDEQQTTLERFFSERADEHHNIDPGQG